VPFIGKDVPSVRVAPRTVADDAVCVFGPLSLPA
jgi:hypothetical protein